MTLGLKQAAIELYIWKKESFSFFLWHISLKVIITCKLFDLFGCVLTLLNRLILYKAYHDMKR